MMTTFFVFVLIILQLTVIAVIVRSTSIETIKAIGKMLAEQNERIAKELQASIAKGTDAAHSAYEEANSVNVKISDLNERLLAEQQGHVRGDA